MDVPMSNCCFSEASGLPRWCGRFHKGEMKGGSNFRGVSINGGIHGDCAEWVFLNGFSTSRIKWGVSINVGSPKWMVCNEKSDLEVDDLRYLREPPL